MTWASAGLLILGSLASFKNVFGAQQAPAGPAPSKDEEEG